MAAEKVVPGNARMVWEKPQPDRYIYTAPIEIEAIRVGTMFLHVNPNLPRLWKYKLTFRGEDVYRLDVRPTRAGHENPPDAPSEFPSKVPEKEHEHVWVEGFGLACAKPITGLEASDHSAIFQTFCVRTNVRFDREYVAPQAYEQTQMPV